MKVKLDWLETQIDNAISNLHSAKDALYREKFLAHWSLAIAKARIEHIMKLLEQ